MKEVIANWQKDLAEKDIIRKWGGLQISFGKKQGRNIIMERQMKNKTEFTPEEIAEIKRIHENFVARLKEIPKQEGTVKDFGDDLAERAVIKRWAEDPEAMVKDLKAMGALE